MGKTLLAMKKVGRKEQKPRHCSCRITLFVLRPSKEIQCAVSEEAPTFRRLALIFQKFFAAFFFFFETQRQRG